jgi:hypothetical protein
MMKKFDEKPDGIQEPELRTVDAQDVELEEV